jgi:parallel beta-helix repeat protein
MRKWIILALFVLAPVLSYAQYQPFNGFCQLGGQFVLTQGLSSITKVQATYPKCTVTVYLTGTLNLATIYSTAGGAALGNSFQANTDGSFLFFASGTAQYDVVTSASTSGGTPVMPSPFTYTGVILNPPTSNKPSVDVQRDCGAVGDGTTDDTAAIQACFNAYTDVYFPGGKVFAACGLQILTHKYPNPPFRLSGPGTIKAKNSCNSNILYLQDVDDMQIEGLEIDGNRTNQGTSHYGIYAVNANYLKLHHNFIHDVNGSCVVADISAGLSDEWTVNDNSILFCQGYGLYKQNSGDDAITNNHIDFNLYDGISYVGGYTSVIQGNDVLTNTQAGISIHGSRRFVISNNQVRENTQRGIYIDTGGGHIITNNRVHWNSQAGQDSYDGVYITGSDNNIFASNQSNDDGYAGAGPPVSGVSKQRYGLKADNSPNLLIGGTNDFNTNHTGTVNFTGTTTLVGDAYYATGTFTGALTAGSIPSPGVIGGGTPAGATFTTLVANTSLVVNGGTALTTTNQTGTGSIVLNTSPVFLTQITTPKIVGVTDTNVVANLHSTNSDQLLAGTWAIPGTIGSTTPNTGVFTTLTGATHNTSTNCAVNSVSPAACGSAAAGAFVVPTTTTTYTVNTSAVTTHSRIFLQPITFASDLPSTPTCVAPLLTSDYSISALVNATSFTMALTSTTGTTCWMYFIVD